MNMENFTSVFNSADGPTSIFVAGKTPEIMGVLIAIVVVGVIISLFGLKLVRVLSAMMGLGTGAVIGAVIGDSEVDAATGRNAGLKTIGVLWGFRDRKTLETAGADDLIDRPDELLQFV